MPNTDIRYPADPRKQNHYERWLAERKVQKDDNCGCAWCLEWDGEASLELLQMRIQLPEVPVSKISTPDEGDIKPLPVIMRQHKGRQKQIITPDQQATLDRTDLTVRQAAIESGISPATVGRYRKQKREANNGHAIIS